MATLYASYTTGDDGGQSLDHTDEVLTQTFTPSITHIPIIVKFLVYRVGSPGGISVSIRATTGDEPDDSTELFASPDATFGFDGDSLTTDTSGEWVAVLLEPVEADVLYASTLYCVTLEGGSVGGSDYIVWRQDTSSPTYTDGKFGMSTDNGNNWTMDATKDAMFEEWGVLPRVGDQTIARDKVTLELIRNIEMSYGGRFFISKSGDATYQTRYHRNV